MNTEEIKLLQAQNEALKKQCNSLQQEVKQWKHEYEMLDACIELKDVYIDRLKQENELLKDTIKNKNLGLLAEENEKLKRIIDNVKDSCILTRNEFCESHCLRETVCEKRDCVPIRDITNIYNLTKAEEE